MEVPKSDLSVKQKALLGIDLNYDMDDFLIWFDTPVYLPELWLTQYCDAVSDILVLAGAGVGRLIFTDDLTYYHDTLQISNTDVIIDASRVRDKKTREFLYNVSLQREFDIVENPKTIGVGTVSLYKAVDIIISIQDYKGLVCQEEYRTFLECCNHCIFNSTFEFGDVEVKFLGDYLLHRFNVLLSKYGNLCWLDYTAGNLVDILYTLIQASTSKNNVELRKFYTLLWYYVTYCKSNRLSNDIGWVEAYFNRR